MKCKYDTCVYKGKLVKGFCKTHYYSWRKTPEAAIIYGECKIGGCNNPRYAKELCHLHHHRLQRGNDPSHPTAREKRPAIVKDSIANIPLGVGAKQGYAIIDAEYSHLDNHRWTVDFDGYAVSTGKKLHHMVIGKPTKGFVVDHINGNKLDNRSVNLRFVTYGENLANKGANSLNKIGVKGVYRNKNRKRWCAAITHSGKFRYIGTYDTIEEASRAYDKTATELRGDLAWVNGM